jgi:hypothetical protein
MPVTQGTGICCAIAGPYHKALQLALISLDTGHNLLRGHQRRWQ